MIPYDDLVAALASWRARQGLPVVQTAAVAPAAPRSAPIAAVAAPRSAPMAAVAAPRTAPPNAPPRSASQPAAHAIDDDFDEALIEDSPYEAEGDDYVMQFDQPEQTAVGIAPEPMDGLLVPKRGK